MKPIKLTEDKIRKIVSESLKKILKEEFFALDDKDGAAKNAAIKDINKDISGQRQRLDPYELDNNPEFHRNINNDIFDIDPARAGIFNDNIDINDDEDFLNEIGDTASGQKKLGRLCARRQGQAMGEYNKAVNSLSDEDKDEHMNKMGNYMSRSLDAYDKARKEREKLPHKIAQRYSGVYHSGEQKEKENK